MAEPAFDLDYSIHDFPFDSRPDSKFLYRRVEQAMLDEGFVPGGRTLDVACGLGRLAVGIRKRGGESWGLDPSPEMLGLSRWVFPTSEVLLVRGIAEALPFRDGSFDRVICQGSLDHFVDPQAFMREAAQVLKPGGRLILALANYESLACHLGRLRQWLARDLLGRPRARDRPYWEIPHDHYHKGELSFVRGLGGPWFRLEQCYGVSLLWLIYGWERVLDRLPRDLALGLLATFDRIAYRTPALADMIVSVWRPRERTGPA